MVRGGQREGAGRKSTWVSGAKFEDTSLVRVPKNIKNTVLEIAHKLDAGEVIDLDANSKIKELQSQLANLEFINKSLIEQIEKYKLDLETQSEKSHKLEPEEIVTNSEKLINDLDTNSKDPKQLGFFGDDDSLVDYFKDNPLQSKILALRLGVNTATLSKKKADLKRFPDRFYNWIISKDPDGIKWISLGGDYSKGYVPANNTSVEKLDRLKSWMQANI